MNRLRKEAEAGGPAVLYVFTGGIFNPNIANDYHDSSVWSDVINRLKPDIVVPSYYELIYGKNYFFNLYSTMTDILVLTNANATVNSKLGINIQKHRIIEIKGRKILLLGGLCYVKIKSIWNKYLKVAKILETIT